MKKFLITFVFLFGFSAYALYAAQGTSSNQLVTVTPDPITITTVTDPKTTPVATTPVPTQTPTTVPTTPVTPPKPTPVVTGQYKDGSYTGNAADAYYGYIQVKAVISGGKITDVVFLQYPNDRGTSVYINSQAMPMLKREAISAQSAKVSGVSGASDTSMAFIESLASALAQAKA